METCGARPGNVRKKAVGEACEGESYVRFEVTADGNQDVISQTPFADPTGEQVIEDCLEVRAGFGVSRGYVPKKLDSVVL